jgi:antitoxin (DNA-binding transcriptional repressor) of toxin-antitoxin stability system
MRSVGIKMLKNKLSEYVRIASGGEIVLVTDRDRVVAELGPPRPERSPFVADSLLAEAVRAGFVTPPTLVSSEAPVGQPVMTLHELLADLQRDREER